jgi:hypothetical protein
MAALDSRGAGRENVIYLDDVRIGAAPRVSGNRR